MQKAFTMIELIFVIVIIGILASIAIPRLAATRDDAKVVKIVQSGVQAVHNLGISFASKNDFSNYTIAQANQEAECFTLSATSDGNVTIHLKPTCVNSNVRNAVIELASKNGLLNAGGSDKTFQFSGEKVKF